MQTKSIIQPTQWPKAELQAAPSFVLEPAPRWFSLKLGELWAYHELLYFLVWRDVKVRYKQTALGVCWVVLQPLVMMLNFSLVFGQYAQIPSGGVPYPL